MLHLYGTRGEYQDLGENNFSVCEEVQHNRVFVAGGRMGGGGAKNASIYALSEHERIEKRSDQSVILMLAKHLNTTLNTQG